MAQIADVVQVSAAIDTAVQDLLFFSIGFSPSWGRCSSAPADRMLEVLWEAERRWVRLRSRSSREKEEEAMVERDTWSIGEAERQSIREWLMRLKDAAHDTRVYARDAQMLRRKKAAMTRMLVDRTAKMDERWRELEEQYKSFGYAGTGGLPLAREQVDEAASCGGEESGCSSIDDDALGVPLGRDDDKQRIIHLLKEAEAKSGTAVLPIVGLPGVGKTTLARLVFHHPRFEDYTKAWVHLSSLPLPEKEYDYDCVKEIATAVISRVLPLSGAEESCLQEELDDMKRFMTNNRLTQLLAAGGNKKLLVVLDDIWPVNSSYFNRFVFSTIQVLRRLLCVGTNVVVIATTNSRAIAKHLASIAKPYELHPLSDDMCWAIIKRTTGFFPARRAATVVDSRRGLEIASKCGGLPSVAQALGRIFRSVNPQEWLDICNNIIGVGHNTSHGEYSPSIHSASVFSHLRKAYQRLRVRDRFVFALFAFIIQKGKNCRTLKEDVMGHLRAIADVLVWSSSLLIYLDTSFLLGEQSASTTGVEADEDAIRLLTMNDVVHHFARYVLGDRMIVIDGTNNAVALSHESNSISAYLSLVSNVGSTALNLSAVLPAGIIALRFEGCSKMELSESVFSFGPKYISVLDLNGCSVKKLPSSIGQLKKLRYLNAPGIQDRLLPSTITGLTLLKFLRLGRSRQLLHLPDALGKLRYLYQLDLSGCRALKALPESFDLYHLNLSGCSGLRALPDLFEKMGHLKHLDLSGCSGLHALPKLDTVYLEHLDLSDCCCLLGIIQVLHRHDYRCLRYLNLSHRCGYSVQDWFHLKGLDAVLPKFTKLQFLGLSMCLDPFCYTMPAEQSRRYVDCITGLVELQHLDLSQNKFLRELPERIGNMKQLHTLDISGCVRLRSLPYSIGELKELRTLALSGCPKLKLLPENIRQRIRELPFLQRDELLSSIIDSKVSPPSHAGTSQEGQSQESKTEESIVAARQLLTDLSCSTEPEIMEVPENQ